MKDQGLPSYTKFYLAIAKKNMELVLLPHTSDSERTYPRVHV